MFALINTGGANHIAINIPTDGSEKSLPMLVNMFEHNAKFINKSWSTMEECKPVITISLGDQITIEGQEAIMQVQTNGHVVSEGFELATPEVYISNAKGLKSRDKTIENLRAEVQALKYQIAQLNEKLEIAQQDTESNG